MFNISFDFDETTHKVTNIQVINKEIIKNSSSKIENEFVSNSNYDLEILPGKIQLSTEAKEKLGALIGDRIAINYWYYGPNDAYPIISKADVFTDGVDGLKLTKSKTLTFRGEQRETLLKYGSIFSFEEWRDKTGKIKEGVFKLIPVIKDGNSSIEHELQIEEARIESIDEKELEDDADWLLEL